MTDKEDAPELCTFVEVMEVVGGKWRGTILLCLSHGAKRFNELRREVAPITQKMLSQELRSLERDGLVERVHFAEIPPRVVYSVTELGETLVPIFEQISAWRAHVPEVMKARQHNIAQAQDAAPEVDSED